MQKELPPGAKASIYAEKILDTTFAREARQSLFTHCLPLHALTWALFMKEGNWVSLDIHSVSTLFSCKPSVINYV